MGRFYLHKNGKLIQTGICPDGDELLQGGGEFEVGLGNPPPEIVADTYVSPPPYDVLRAREYPKIGDQLDALWKLLGPGAAPGSEAAEMYRRIEAVKQRIPKPQTP